MATPKKIRTFIDQYGQAHYARTLVELRAKIGGKVSKMYVDKVDGRTVHTGYVFGQMWLTEVQPVERCVEGVPDRDCCPTLLGIYEDLDPENTSDYQYWLLKVSTEAGVPLKETKAWQCDERGEVIGKEKVVSWEFFGKRL